VKTLTRVKAKKIQSGQWEFLGFQIEQVFDVNDRPSHWNIVDPKDPLVAIDSRNTLADAKEAIRRWKARDTIIFVDFIAKLLGQEPII